MEALMSNSSFPANKSLFRKTQKKVAGLCRSILSDKNTRNLFFFLLLNLLFAFVELTYGLLTNSLGLISDSFHMFFDCSALLLGLAASIITKWSPNDTFTYGFGRAEILAGLANGLFLLFIALFIMKEAIERTFEPPEVHHERLFIISVLGFLVNIVGIFVFHHGGQGHHHGSGGCSHSHSHSKSHSHNVVENQISHDYSHYASPTIISNNPGVVALDMNGYSTNDNPTSHTGNFTDHLDHGHDHSHQSHQHHYHHHNHQSDYYNRQNSQEQLLEPVRTKSSGRGQIMQSVFLHIVADTLGSVGVMISALLMNMFGWMIADPICSLFIAILISISVYPLLRDSLYVLMQRVPVELEEKLPSCYHRIMRLTGVVSIIDKYFWTLNNDTYIGCLKLEVSSNADHRYILSNVESILHDIGVDRVHIQIDQEHRH